MGAATDLILLISLIGPDPLKLLLRRRCWPDELFRQGAGGCCCWCCGCWPEVKHEGDGVEAMDVISRLVTLSTQCAETDAAGAGGGNSSCLQPPPPPTMDWPETLLPAMQ